jgi:hypothetical protein
MPAPEPRPGEAYRLRQARLAKGGMQEIIPFPADERLFATYREAATAARLHRTKCPSVITQAIIVDASGNVIFPPDSLPVRSRGRWHVAPMLWGGPAAKTGKKRKRGPANAPRLVAGRPKGEGG